MFQQLQLYKFYIAFNRKPKDLIKPVMVKEVNSKLSVNFGTVELNQTYNLHCSTSMLLWIESTPILLPLNILNCDCCSCIY